MMPRNIRQDYRCLQAIALIKISLTGFFGCGLRTAAESLLRQEIRDVAHLRDRLLQIVALHKRQSVST